MDSRISPPERRWLAFAVLIALLLIGLGSALGFFHSRPDQPFMGVSINAADTFSYYAKMRVGAGGGWLFQNRYAVEAHPASLVYLPFLLLGRLAGRISGQGAATPLIGFVLAFHLLRLISAAWLLINLYRFAAWLLDAPAARRLAWLLMAFGGGLGWLALIITGDPLAFGGLLDLWVGEIALFVPLLTMPHINLALAALIEGLLALDYALAGGGWRYTALTGLCWLVLSAANPFYLLAAVAACAGWLAGRSILARRLDLRFMFTALIAGLPGGVFDGIILWQIGGDPVYAAWNAQNTLATPSLIQLLLAYGPFLPFAAIGLHALWRSQDQRAALLLGWLPLPLLLTLLPLPFQLRLIAGFTLPLGIVTVWGLQGLPFKAPVRAALTGLLLLLCLPTGAFNLLGITAAAAQPGSSAYLSPDEAAAFDYLRTQPDLPVVLSLSEAGVRLPAAAPLISLLGHGFETPAFDAKQIEVEAFLRGDDPQASRALLRRYGVDLVYLGPAESALLGPAFDPASLGLRQVFQQGEVTIWRYGEQEPETRDSATADLLTCSCVPCELHADN